MDICSYIMDIIISRREIKFRFLDDFWPDCVALNIIVYNLGVGSLRPWGYDFSS